MSVVSGPPPPALAPAASASSAEPPQAATDRTHRAVAMVSVARDLSDRFTGFLLSRGCWLGLGRWLPSRDHEALVVLRGDVAGDLPVGPHPTDVGHEDPWLAGGVGAEEPGVRRPGVERLAGHLVDVL